MNIEINNTVINLDNILSITTTGDSLKFYGFLPYLIEINFIDKEDECLKCYEKIKELIKPVHISP